jgi:UDP-sugar transporter A1/2/3
VFSVAMLGRSLSSAKWLSLFILTAGVSLTEMDAAGGGSKAPRGGEGTQQSPLLGFVCVLMASVTSGFAGVWFEKILKNAKTSLWVRNIQMGLTSVLIAFAGVYTKDRATVAEKGFFHGYSGAVVGVIMLQALGGLVVATVVKYADNILKGFGSSISIVISCLLESLFFDFRPTLRFVVGATLVNYAMYLYASDWQLSLKTPGARSLLSEPAAALKSRSVWLFRRGAKAPPPTGLSEPGYTPGPLNQVKAV